MNIVTAAAKIFRRNLVVASALALCALPTTAAPVLGPWVPLFKGISHLIGTNVPTAGSLPHRMVMHALRVDLTDPDIQFLTTPRFTNYANSARETGGLTVSGFLRTNKVQAAINANLFETVGYYVAAMTPMDVYGLHISQGVVVSPQDTRDYSASLLFDIQNKATLISSNWPAASTNGVYTAVSGTYAVLLNGVDIARPWASLGGELHGPNPRTAFGLSADRRWLYLMTIDGRQPGYSDGAYDYETAEWLLLIGASDGINMDGGGSTTLTVADSTGAAVRLNKPSAVADSGKERTIASHFGVFAKPLPGFINDVGVLPDDTTAQVTWTTTAPATSKVQYGLSTNFSNATIEDSNLLTNHTVQLSGLTPNQPYYFRVLSTSAGQQYISSNYLFYTTNYVVTNAVFAITNDWKYFYGDAGAGWTAPSFDDSTWSGPGAGLFWVDVRATGPNPEVAPKNTQMPVNPANAGYPYVTYYFRRSLLLPASEQGGTLAFAAYVDDGAVFYINGKEVYRLRVPLGADAATIASAYPCDGDATCADEFSVDLSSIPNLAHENTIAVEVHNYNVRSADITFGLAVDHIAPVQNNVKLSAQIYAGSISLIWSGSGFVLQQSASPAGPWADFSSTNASPVTISPTAARAFYRLRR